MVRKFIIKIDSHGIAATAIALNNISLIVSDFNPINIEIMSPENQ